MEESRLKDKLMSCEDGPFQPSDFSIGHRGAPLQFPEHTVESYTAAARMGAGILECDVTFTKDRELVCRHSQNDLHTTTNIVDTPLNAQCTVPWSGPGSSPKCCASDLTLAEFKTLKGKYVSPAPIETDATIAAGPLTVLQTPARLPSSNSVQKTTSGLAHVAASGLGDWALVVTNDPKRAAANAPSIFFTPGARVPWLLPSQFCTRGLRVPRDGQELCHHRAVVPRL